MYRTEAVLDGCILCDAADMYDMLCLRRASLCLKRGPEAMGLKALTAMGEETYITASVHAPSVTKP